MGAPTAVLLSFRLGGTDGVSVEARKWEWALGVLGFTTRRVAGEFADGLRPDDGWLAFLATEPGPRSRVEPDALAAALAGVDLVVVENLCSLPVNPVASATAAEVLGDHAGRVLFHHHDLPWERPNLPAVPGLPPRRANSLHITINDAARYALTQHGIEAHTIRNAFDLDPQPGDRGATRAAFAFGDAEVVVLQPTRAIPRKEVGRGLAFAEQLAGLVGDRSIRFWITGPAEDRFGPELERIVAAAKLPVTEGRARRPQDAYAAADIVVVPSSWEGFGNPVIEATVAERPVVVAHYPVLDELLALGLRFFSVDEPAAIAAWLRDPDPAVIDDNRACVRSHFDLADLPGRIGAAFSAVGWDRW